MKLKIVRDNYTARTTLGKLYVNGIYFAHEMTAMLVLPFTSSYRCRQLVYLISTRRFCAHESSSLPNATGRSSPKLTVEICEAEAP